MTISISLCLNFEKKNEGKDKGFIEKLKRDRDMYKKELERADSSNKKVEEEILNKEKFVKEKENELFGQKKEIEKLNKEIIILEKERDANSFQATSAEAKYFYSRDEVKLRDNFVFECSFTSSAYFASISSFSCVIW